MILASASFTHSPFCWQVSPRLRQASRQPGDPDIFLVHHSTHQPTYREHVSPRPARTRVMMGAGAAGAAATAGRACGAALGVVAGLDAVVDVGMGVDVGVGVEPG